MPLELGCEVCFLRRTRRRGWLNNLNPEAPTDHASEDPVHNADEEDDQFVRLGEIPSDDIENRYRTTNHAQPKPPDNPAVNPQMNVHLCLLGIRCDCEGGRLGADLRSLRPRISPS